MIRIKLAPAVVIPALFVDHERWEKGYGLKLLALEMDAHPDALRDAGGWGKIIEHAEWLPSREVHLTGGTMKEIKTAAIMAAIEEEPSLTAAAERLDINMATLWRYRTKQRVG